MRLLLILLLCPLLAFAGHSGDNSGRNTTVIQAIEDGATYTGMPKTLMIQVAKKESTFNPNARNSRSHALGLYQVVDKTWAYLVSTYGQAYDLSLEDRTDPLKATIGAGLLMREYKTRLERVLKRDITNKEVYLAYFAGPGTAIHLLRSDQDTPIEEVMNSASVRANPHIQGCTVGEAIGKITKGIDND